MGMYYKEACLTSGGILVPELSTTQTQSILRVFHYLTSDHHYILSTHPSDMDTPRSDQTHTNLTSRTASLGSTGERMDYLDLPVREVNDGADLREYTTETPAGEIIKPVKSNVTGQMEDWKLVTFTIDDPENPKNWSKAFKWYCTMVVAFTCFVVAFCSSVITADLVGPMEAFHVSREVSFVVVSVFVIGFGVGKLNALDHP